jgi:16S rRNA (cytosine967-C5)-methyltransferase
MRKSAGAQRPPPPEATPGYVPRWVAAQAIGDALTYGKPLDDRFPGPDGDATSQILDPRDRALARSIATVAMRRLGTIRKGLARFLEKGMPRKAGPLEPTLIAAAAQILFLDASDFAAVDLAVRAVRADPASTPYAALANAVLRNVARAKADILSDAQPLDDAPSWLVARWKAHYGEATALAIAAAHLQEPTLDLTVKSDPEGWAAKLGGTVLPTGSVRLETHAPIPELEGFGDGEWWVQDAAAALPARLLRPAPGMHVADLCAAPGGKTAQLAAAGAVVSAVERDPSRLARMRENLGRLRLTADLVAADAVAWQPGEVFEAVLLDAPCSATGTIRRHPDVPHLKRARDLPGLAAQQDALLDAACALLRPGGTLVFSVCSLQPEEGPERIAAALRRLPLQPEPVAPAELPGLAGAITADGFVHTTPALWPERGGMDGFFVARLRRQG